LYTDLIEYAADYVAYFILLQSVAAEYKKDFVFNFSKCLDEHILTYSLLHIYKVQQAIL